jgi:hypothetical protein
LFACFLAPWGRGKEANECFEASGDLARGEKPPSVVTASITRAIRAEAGAIAPANSCILAEQGR